jgi:hypothetical protein
LTVGPVQLPGTKLLIVHPSHNFSPKNKTMNDQHENRRSMIGRIGYKTMMIMIVVIAVFGTINLQFLISLENKAYHRSTENVLPSPPKRDSRHNVVSRLQGGSKSRKPKLVSLENKAYHRSTETVLPSPPKRDSRHNVVPRPRLQGGSLQFLISLENKAHHRSTKNVLPSPPKRDSPHNAVPRLQAGSKSRKPKLLIAGTAKDASLHLGSLKKGMERFLRNFDLVRLVIYENDSQDNTIDILQGWNLSTDLTFAGKVDLIYETNITLQFLSEMPPEDVYWKLRPKILAHGRNKLWQQITNISKQEDIGYVLMMDLDEVNYHLSHVHECFNLPSGWGGCCANNHHIYYDLWALRTFDDWMPGDCFQSANGELRFDKEEPDWVTQFKHISASHPPIRVRSCFGGAALYDFHRLKGLHLDTYDGINPETGNAICEHVPFHDSLKEQIPDFEMYIQPKMLNDGGRSDVTTGFQKLREHEINASLSNPELKHYYDALKT